MFLPWDQEHLGNPEGRQIQWDPEIKAEVPLKLIRKASTKFY